MTDSVAAAIRHQRDKQHHPYGEVQATQPQQGASTRSINTFVPLSGPRMTEVLNMVAQFPDRRHLIVFDTVLSASVLMNVLSAMGRKVAYAIGGEPRFHIPGTAVALPHGAALKAFIANEYDTLLYQRDVACTGGFHLPIKDVVISSVAELNVIQARSIAHRPRAVMFENPEEDVRTMLFLNSGSSMRWRQGQE